ncbi:Protein Wnt, partial [Operophtera brumata]
RLLSCGCDPLGYRTSHESRGRSHPNKWDWSGCSHNLAYGVEFSRKFLDVREQVDDLQSKINILSSHMEVRCKCHGMSGSCQLRTCWRATPDFRIVATTIKRQYRKIPGWTPPGPQAECAGSGERLVPDPATCSAVAEDTRSSEGRVLSPATVPSTGAAVSTARDVAMISGWL